MNNKLAIISIGRASQMILMFVTYRVLSHLFSVEEMGGYYFLLSIAGAFGLIIANPLGMFANRKIHEWKASGKLIKNLNNLILAFALSSLLTIPFLFLFHEKLSTVNLPLFYIVGMLIFFIFTNTIQSTLIPTMNLLGEATHFVAWTFASSIMALLCSYIIVTYFNHDPMFWLLGQGISFTVFSVVAYYFIGKKFPDHTSDLTIRHTDNISSILKFSLPIALTNIFVWSMAQSFRFFLKDKINPTTFGEMTFGLGLATSLSVAVEYLFQQLFLPKFYQGLGADTETKEKSWNLFLNKVLPSYLIYTAYLFGLSPFLIRVLADVKFKNAGQYLALGAFVELFRMTSNVFTMATHAEMKTEKALWPYFTGGSFTLISILFVAYNPQFVGLIPIFLAMGYLASCLLLNLNVKQFFKIKINFKTIINYFCLSFIFLLPSFFLKGFSNSMPGSILICFIFGLFLLYLFYIQYKKSEGESL